MAMCLLLLLLCAPAARACGPFFPNALLDDGDQAILRAPTGDYRHEIERIRSSKSGQFRAVVPTEHQSPREQTAECDLADLKAALAAAKTPADEAQRIVNGYARARKELLGYEWEVGEWERKVATQKAPHPPRPAMPAVKVPAGLPPEFADYIAGAIAQQRGDLAAARAAWQRLLDRPADQRRWRSTWAAFMLGLTAKDGEDPAAVAAVFRKVRDLAAKGFVDSLGLAAASYGMEARAYLAAAEYSRAAELYLDQHACGDPTAVWSLRILTTRILDKEASIKQAAADPTLRRLTTAHVLANGGPFQAGPDKDKVTVWLAAIEGAGAQKVVDADRLAMICYQQGQWNLAQRWADRSAPDSALGLWVRSKLLFREGKLDDARAALAKAVRAFPEDETWDHYAGSVDPDPGDQPVAIKHMAQGELGVLLLSREQYSESLACLFDAGYWEDAAYLAERILTVDELKQFVDRRPAKATTSPGPDIWESNDLHYLLARRLTRVGRWKEARPYFPDAQQPRLDAYISAIRGGHDAKRTPAERAASLWAAAQICRYEGMELLGTEIGPDGTIVGGNFEWRDPLKARLDPKITSKAIAPAKDEVNRYQQSAVTPNKRFHYRYVAADHAWDAAGLLPDNDDQTATILCTAGTWLKNRDPDAAQRFYKALVTRCPNTELGKAAASRKWFPPIKEPAAKPEDTSATPR